MVERLQTVLSRRSSAKRCITNIATRCGRVKGDGNARETVQDLRKNRVGALDKFRELDSQLLPLLEAAVVSDEPAGKRTVSEDIGMSETYITRADDVIFEANRYLEILLLHPPRRQQSPRRATRRGIKFLFVQ